MASVDVEAVGLFGVEGAPASRITCNARIAANAPEAVIRDLAAATDRVAEIQNTVRRGIDVRLDTVTAVSRE